MPADLILIQLANIITTGMLTHRNLSYDFSSFPSPPASHLSSSVSASDSSESLLTPPPMLNDLNTMSHQGRDHGFGNELYVPLEHSDAAFATPYVTDATKVPMFQLPHSIPGSTYLGHSSLPAMCPVTDFAEMAMPMGNEWGY